MARVGVVLLNLWSRSELRDVGPFPLQPVFDPRSSPADTSPTKALAWLISIPCAARQVTGRPYPARSVGSPPLRRNHRAASARNS